MGSHISVLGKGCYCYLYFRKLTLITAENILQWDKIKKLLLLIQVRNDYKLNRVSSNGDGLARFGIHFKGRAARMSRKWLIVHSSDYFFFPLCFGF